MKKICFRHCLAVFIVTLLLLLSFSSQVFAESKGWKHSGSRVRYYTGNEYVKNKVKKIGSYYYYFDRSGNRKTGWVKWNHNRYYFSPENARAYTGAKTIDEDLYLFRKNGTLITGPQKRIHTVGGSKYLIDSKAHAYKLGSGRISKKTLKRKGIDKCSRLMIVAHPDDETFWGADHLDRYNDYFVVCLTNAHNSIRNEEFQEALRTTGSRGIILSYPDISKHQKVVWDEKTRARIRKDIWTVVTWKKWKSIVTHNPEGEYGHIHHILTNELVTQVCEIRGVKRKLWYFGRFYSPKDLDTLSGSMEKISEASLEKKLSTLEEIYTSQRKAYLNLSHMAPYETWVKADNWR